MSAINIFRTICPSLSRPRCKTLSTPSVSQSVSCLRLPGERYILTNFAEDEMDVAPLNLGMIAAYYNISCMFISEGW